MHVSYPLVKSYYLLTLTNFLNAKALSYHSTLHSYEESQSACDGSSAGQGRD